MTKDLPRFKSKIQKEEKFRFWINSLSTSKLFFILVLILPSLLQAQINIEADAFFSPSTGTITIHQSIDYINNSADTLTHLYLNDWINAFKDKDSPLGKHFSSQYISRFHFSKPEERGETRIDFLSDLHRDKLNWSRPSVHPDLIKINLTHPLPPHQKTHIELQYTLRIPEDKFTRYGKNDLGDYDLRYWLIVPAVYTTKWEIYSNKSLADQFSPKTDVEINLKVPKEYRVYTNLNQKETQADAVLKNILLRGKNVSDLHLMLTQTEDFDHFKLDSLQVLTNIDDEGVPQENRATTIKRIIYYLNHQLGPYPFDKILISTQDYKSNPIYGLNQLPSFIRPFPDGFQYELKMVKSITHEYLKNGLLLNPRENEWLINAIEIYLLMDYVDTYYPHTKLIGTLSKVFGIRWFHIADLDFNTQYQFYWMNMNRKNIDQALLTNKDSLVKFNAEIANPYKAGVGFKYLEDFIGKKKLKRSIKAFYKQNQLTYTDPKAFSKILKANTSKDIDWFFDEFVKTNKRLDFKIKSVKRIDDSLEVTIHNNVNNHMPVSLYTLKNKQVIAKYWIENIHDDKTITIPDEGADKLALNYEEIIPEINKRNNYKSLKGLFNKPLKPRLIKDVEDPFYNEFYLLPDINYDLYDGFKLGMRISNRSVLFKSFNYAIDPVYGTRSRALIGKLSFYNQHQFRNKNLSDITYGFSGSRYSYDVDLFYYKYNPFITFTFRHRDLRNRERQYITLRDVGVYRDNPNNDLAETPNYNVIDLQYTYSNKNLISSFVSTFDYQIGQKFSKASITAKYRKLFLNNQQIEFRLFAGGFLYNNTHSDYFNFSLDRPTDYLFDYNYYGRSESSGFFSQQFIQAEGGFKSQFDNSFANRWMTTFNTNVSIFPNWIYAYGDVGFYKNRGQSAQFKFDSGLRLSLVQDYFEVFFPIYSSMGWEVRQPHYNEKIRFIITLDIKTLIGLFERTYY